MKPKFLLGLGAQKAGTTWLHHILASQIFCNMGFMKEYHIWDAKFSPLCEFWKVTNTKPDTPLLAWRRLMQQNDNVYTDYFRNLMDDDVVLTGDITPSYSLLNEEALTHIKNCIVHAGFELKVIFLMRDPIARFWSAVRMDKRSMMRKKIDVDDEWVHQKFLRNLHSAEHIGRSDYVSIIERIERVFDADQVYFELYEDLFTEQAMSELQTFLGVEFSNIDFKERKNASPITDINKDLQQEAYHLLSNQYSYCNQRFPRTKEVWGHY